MQSDSMATATEDNKNEEYWNKRRKNNEAARRSREKRRMNDLLLERRVMQLTEENKNLRTQLLSLKIKYGDMEEVKFPQSFGNDVDNTFLDLTESTFQTKLNDSRYDRLGCINHGNSKGLNLNTSIDDMSQKFTARVFTNATGDTSATVLVNSSSGFSTKSSKYPQIDINDGLSRFMNKLSDENREMKQSSSEISTEFQSSAFGGTNLNLADPSTRCQLPVPGMLDLSGTGREALSKPQQLFNGSDASVAPSDLKSLKSGGAFSNSSFPSPLNNLPLLNLAIMQMIKDCYGKLDQQIPNCSASPQQMFFPPNDISLQQIQTHLAKAQALAAAEKDHTAGAKKNDLPFKMSSSLFENKDVFTQFPALTTSRHNSTDSGIGSNENSKNPPNSSPLSPPPSPDHRQTFSTRISSSSATFPAEHKEQEEPLGLVTHFRKTRERSRSVFAHHPDEEVSRDAESERSVSTSSIPGPISNEQDHKNKSEFQLPHKLRLKKPSAKSDQTTGEIQAPAQSKQHPFQDDLPLAKQIDSECSVKSGRSPQIKRSDRFTSSVAVSSGRSFSHDKAKRKLTNDTSDEDFSKKTRFAPPSTGSF